MFNVINPSWSHSLVSEVANLKPVNIRYAAINQFYYQPRFINRKSSAKPSVSVARSGTVAACAK